MTLSGSASAAKQYYTQSLRPGDYYARGTAERGVWFGVGAERLGLHGEVRGADFDALCDNRQPGGRASLTVRSRAGRRVGYDLNFHVPKSVSILMALTDDQSIREHFIASVKETLVEIESDARTRVRTGTSDEDRITGNVVGALFVHDTARPVDGWPDPHLHAHAFVFNATFDPVEKRWKALQVGEIKRDGGYYEARFHARLSLRLAQAGYGIVRRGRFWELTGVPVELIQRFSRRAKQVQAEAERLGIAHDAKLRDKLAAVTRSAKRADLTPDQLRSLWRSVVTEVEVIGIRKFQTRATSRVRPAVPTVADARTIDAAIEHALEHHLERASTIASRRAVDTATRHLFGLAHPQAVEKALADRPLVRGAYEGREFVSTEAVLEEERRMLTTASAWRGTFQPIDLFTPVSLEVLSAEQADLVRHVLTSPDGIILIRGAAGTGKTRLMTEAVAMIERAGKRVTLLAPTAEAAHDVLAKEGFKDPHTLARFLVDEKLQRQAAGQVVWVDEAGLIGSPVFARLLRSAEQYRFRIVLGGDQRQHHSVERGDAFRLLIERAHLPVAELSHVRRQTGIYREAAECLGRGDIAGGWGRLVSIGAVEQLAVDQIYQRIAAEYERAVQSRRSCLIVAPTHAERRAVTTALRERLIEMHRLGTDAATVEHLRPLDWTTAERREPWRYESGQVVRFHTPAPGFRAGVRYAVVRAGTHAPRVVAMTGRNIPAASRALPLHLAERFAVFEPQALELRSGDLIRFTRNLRTPDARFTNGNIARVKSVEDDGSLLLADGRVVPAEWGHFDHGYTLTSHASQGKTVDQVLVVQTSLSLAATNAEQFYVSVTRGRHAVRIFTDDAQSLREHIELTSARQTALELSERSSKVSQSSPRRQLEDPVVLRRSPQPVAALLPIRRWV